MTTRRGVKVAIGGGALLAFAAAANACSESNRLDHTVDGGTSDAPPGIVDAAVLLDAASPQSDASDASVDVDASSLSVSTGPTGTLWIAPRTVLGGFFEDDDVVRSTDSPGCVVVVRSSSEQRSSGGKLTVGGSFLGDAGAPSSPVEIEPLSDADPAADQSYLHRLSAESFYLQPNGGVQIQVSLAGTPNIPAIPVTTMQAPRGSLVVTAPTPPDGDASLFVDSTKDFVVEWTTDATVGERVILRVTDLGSGNGRSAELNCSWPMSDGQGKVSASLLNVLKSRLANGAFSPLGFVTIMAGDARELSVRGGSYFTFTSFIINGSTFPATSFEFAP